MPLRRSLLSFGFASAALCAANSAIAQTSGDVIFNGSLLDICIVAVSTPGTITPNASYTSMSSENPGGGRGLALVTTTSLNFDLAIDAPTTFTSMPVGGDSGVSYDALVSATGVTSLTDVVAGALSSLGLGVTNLQVGVTATKGAGVFPAGAYQIPVTIRCEAS